MSIVVAKRDFSNKGTIIVQEEPARIRCRCISDDSNNSSVGFIFQNFEDFKHTYQLFTEFKEAFEKRENASDKRKINIPE